MHRGHQLPVRVERERGGAGRACFFRLQVDSGFSGSDQERSLGRIAKHAPAQPARRIGGKQARIAAQASGPEHGAGRGRIGDLTLGPVADTGHLVLPAGLPHRLHRHLRLGQSAGLVGADDRGRAESLDRRQPFDQRVPAGHAADRHGQRHRHRGRQPLGHQGHHHAEREHERANDLMAGKGPY